MNERDMTIVFIAPTRNRNCFGDWRVSEISEPRTAACPEPKPGRNEERGAVRAAAITLLKVCFFGSLIFFIGVIVCLGIFVLFFMEMRRAEIPNRPVRSGRSGCSTGRFNVRKPRKPAKIKTVSEIRNSFSLKTKYNDAKIKMNGIIGFDSGKIFGRR